MGNENKPAQHVRVNGMVRDKNGKPKVDENKLDYFWNVLSAEDKAHLLEKYPNYKPQI